MSKKEIKLKLGEMWQNLEISDHDLIKICAIIDKIYDEKDN